MHVLFKLGRPDRRTRSVSPSVGSVGRSAGRQIRRSFHIANVI